MKSRSFLYYGPTYGSKALCAKRYLCAPLLLLLLCTNCGTKDPSSNFTGSCQLLVSTNSAVAACIDMYNDPSPQSDCGTAFSSIGMTGATLSGTYSSSHCSQAADVGECKVQSNDPSADYNIFFFSPFTQSASQSTCGQMGVQSGIVSTFVPPVQSNGPAPTRIPGTITAISQGGYQECALVSGGVWCMNTDGTSNLAAVPGLSSGVTAISAGYSHACAVMNGGAWCWGANDSGQLGTGSVGGSSSAPVQVHGLSSGVTAISAGLQYTCAIVNSGAMCWGTNADGVLGNGTASGTVATPAAVKTLTSKVTGISAGATQSCAVASGRAYCWGTADPSGTPQTTAADMGFGTGVTAVSVGSDFGSAIVNGEIEYWFIGGYSSTSFAHLIGPALVPGVTGATAISGTCAIISGGLQCWGDGDTAPTSASAVDGLTYGVTALSGGVWVGWNWVIQNNSVQNWDGSPPTEVPGL